MTKELTWNEDADAIPYVGMDDLECQHCHKNGTLLALDVNAHEYYPQGPDIKAVRIRLSCACMECGKLTTYRLGARATVNANMEWFQAKMREKK